MIPVTKIVITDPELRTKLAAAEGRIIFEGPNGDPVRTVKRPAPVLIVQTSCPFRSS
jgi:hypothetical protein